MDVWLIKLAIIVSPLGLYMTLTVVGPLIIMTKSIVSSVIDYVYTYCSVLCHDQTEPDNPYFTQGVHYLLYYDFAGIPNIGLHKAQNTINLQWNIYFQ